MHDAQLAQEAAERRRDAANRYRPEHIKLLLVAEAPPPLLSRYFYFEDVEHHDGLFYDVLKALTGAVRPERGEKALYLAELMALGVFLTDMREDPLDSRPLLDLVEPLIERCRMLAPEKII